MSQPSEPGAPASDAPGAATPPERHPRELYILFATEMWERFGFYTMLSVFTLYLRSKGGGLGWSEVEAANVYSNYLMFVYASPLIGGFLADRMLGYRLSVLIGAVVFVAGYALLTFPSVAMIYTALALLVVANGFFKPNISTMVGNLYPSGSHLRDSAYNIFYMGINIGAFMAPLVAEVVRQRYGFRAAFAAAAVGMGIGLVIFLLFQHRLASAERKKPAAGPVPAAEPGLPGEVTGAQPPAPAPTHRHSAMEAVPEWKRITALLVIFAIVIVFWMSFHQNGLTMTFWANDNTDWNASRITPLLMKLFTLGLIDTSDVSGVISNAINPFWIIVLSIPLVRFWRFLGRHGLEPSTPGKMALGMYLTFAAFMILYFAAISGGNQTFLYDDSGRLLLDENGVPRAVQNQVSPWWLIAAYGVLSLGELMLSPMGLSLVSKVAPERMRGLMMGGWFVATAIGNKLTMIGAYWPYWDHSTFWLVVALLALTMAIVLTLLLRPLKRAMPGV